MCEEQNRKCSARKVRNIDSFSLQNKSFTKFIIIPITQLPPNQDTTVAKYHNTNNPEKIG